MVCERCHKKTYVAFILRHHGTICDICKNDLREGGSHGIDHELQELKHIKCLQDEHYELLRATSVFANPSELPDEVPTAGSECARSPRP